MARIGRRHSKGEKIDDRRGRDCMDPDLLGQLLDRHAAALELYARQWCEVPEDVVQDAFLKLAGQRGTRKPCCLAVSCRPQQGY